jgi:translocation and assembly module TamB
MLTAGIVPDTGNGTDVGRASRLAFFIGRNIASTIGLNDEEKLTIRSGENFTREGRETVYVQYDLDGRWSIVGEYDRFDAYNGGIKFRLVDR